MVKRIILRKYRFAVFGTGCELFLLSETTAEADHFAVKVSDWLKAFEVRYSRFQPGSIVSCINQQAGGEWTKTDTDLEHILDIAESAWRATNGAIDITALPLYRLWHSKRTTDPSQEEIKATVKRVGFGGLHRKNGRVRLQTSGMEIDLGGIAKEYAVDQVCELERPHAIKGLLVCIGGDLRACGKTPEDGWQIALEAPGHQGDKAALIRLKRGAVATSGDSRRSSIIGNGCRSHIIDPRSGNPATGPSSATVFAPTCTEAGIHATAACLQRNAENAITWLRQKGYRAVVTKRKFPAEAALKRPTPCLL